MYIRNYQLGEEEIRQLFYIKVHGVNTNDYSPFQLKAWAPKAFDIEAWKQKLKQLCSFVCIHKNKIIGYSDLQANGYIDHFFCHKDYQGQGVARELMEHIHQLASQ